MRAYRLHIQSIKNTTMKATVENNELVIRIPMNSTPAPSASGKTLIVASSGGNQKTAVTVQGKQVCIGLNAYIPR